MMTYLEWLARGPNGADNLIFAFDITLMGVCCISLIVAVVVDMRRR